MGVRGGRVSASVMEDETERRGMEEAMEGVGLEMEPLLTSFRALDLGPTAGRRATECSGTVVTVGAVTSRVYMVGKRSCCAVSGIVGSMLASISRLSVR